MDQTAVKYMDPFFEALEGGLEGLPPGGSLSFRVTSVLMLAVTMSIGPGTPEQGPGLGSRFRDSVELSQLPQGSGRGFYLSKDEIKGGSSTLIMAQAWAQNQE